jgi:hypothetical protein
MTTVLRLTVAPSLRPAPWHDGTTEPPDAWEYALTAYDPDGATRGTMSGSYWTGVGLRRNGKPTAPTVGDVLECLCSDALMVEDYGNNLAAFLFGLGFCGESEADMRRGIETHAEMVRQTSDLRRLLGHDYEAAVYGAPAAGWSNVRGITITIGAEVDR